MAFKLHKIKTVLRHLKKSWPDSAQVKKHCPRNNRLKIYFSLLYWFFFYGNDLNDYCTFRFWERTHKEKQSYISLRRNDRLRFALSTPEVYQLFLDKAKFNLRFSKYINRQWLTTDNATAKDIEDFIFRTKTIIAKPLSDFGGRGIMKFDSDMPAISYIQQLAQNNYILEECIENAPSIKEIAPNSLNTIRIVTLIDRNGMLHILAALLRMGNGKSFTDNYHDGGMACAIDINTGCLKGKAFGMDCMEFERHPLSDIKFDGFPIPEFDTCMKIVRKIAFEEPSARYVGWDFAITPRGIDVIEGNIPPGEDITQISAGRGLWYEVNELI